jgi:small subunit ribosomal protein S11
MHIFQTILGMGISTIRVAIQGLGPGRISSIKGLQMSGLKIVAIADVTPITFQYRCRAKKARRI